jgi:hypothetical protein
MKSRSLGVTAYVVVFMREVRNVYKNWGSIITPHIKAYLWSNVTGLIILLGTHLPIHVIKGYSSKMFNHIITHYMLLPIWSSWRSGKYKFKILLDNRNLLFSGFFSLRVCSPGDFLLWLNIRVLWRTLKVLFHWASVSFLRSPQFHSKAENYNLCRIIKLWKSQNLAVFLRLLHFVVLLYLLCFGLFVFLFVGKWFYYCIVSIRHPHFS